MNGCVGYLQFGDTTNSAAVNILICFIWWTFRCISVGYIEYLEDEPWSQSRYVADIAKTGSKTVAQLTAPPAVWKDSSCSTTSQYDIVFFFLF